jgi:hypothetical protein
MRCRLRVTRLSTFEAFFRSPFAIFVALWIIRRFIPEHDQRKVVLLQAYLLAHAGRRATTLDINPKIGKPRVDVARYADLMPLPIE